MFLAAQGSHEMWDLVNKLVIIAGIAFPLVLAGWMGRNWLVANVAAKQELNDVRDEFDDFKKAMSERSITDAARYEKLEREWLELLRVMAKGRKH